MHRLEHQKMAAALRYVPVLRWKAGEERALRELSQQARALTTPVLVIEPHEFDPLDLSGIDETFNSEMERDVQKLERSWQGGRAFVDLNALEGAATVNGEEHPVTYFFREARSRGLDVAPVVDLASDDDYLAAALASSQGGQGAMLRLFFGELDDLDMNAAIDERLQVLGLPPGEIDLLLDLQGLRHPVALAVQAALLELSRAREWRSITLASGAFPQTLAAYAPGIHRLPRDDWRLWQRLFPNMPFDLAYGDYGTVCPDRGDAIDPRFMNPSASIKYTLQEDWLVLRGSGVRTPGGGGHAQFADQASVLVQRPEYVGRDFSYGDQQIQRIADGDVGPGNLTTWVTIAVNHHVEFAVRQLAG